MIVAIVQFQIFPKNIFNRWCKHDSYFMIFLMSIIWYKWCSLGSLDFTNYFQLFCWYYTSILSIVTFFYKKAPSWTVICCISGSVRGGSSGSTEPLNFEREVKLNLFIFSIWITTRYFGTQRFIFEPLDSKN